MKRFQVAGVAVLLAVGLYLVVAAPANAASGVMGLKLDNKGGKVVIVSVMVGSEPSKAGIRKGWSLFQINGVTVRDTAHALTLKAGLPDNKPIDHAFFDLAGKVHVFPLTFPGSAGGVVIYGTEKKAKK